MAGEALIEVTRGAEVESRHRAAGAAIDSRDHVLAGWGEIATPVFPRSAIKPIQALPLVETGAARAFGLGDREIALACASHAGEPEHIAVAGAWLHRLGLEEDALACGAHRPANEHAADTLVRAGNPFSPLHNNCSGKHVGFLSAALHRVEPISGYHRREHPAQGRWIGALSELSGESGLAGMRHGIDGCGVPTIALPLVSLARAFARFADPDRLPEPRAEAVHRITAALRAEPFMIAGTDRLATRIVGATRGVVIAKNGAEGVYGAFLPERRIGIAIKVADGAARAAQAMLMAVLDRLDCLDAGARGQLANFLHPAVRNWAGDVVGAVRVRLP